MSEESSVPPSESSHPATGRPSGGRPPESPAIAQPSGVVLDVDGTVLGPLGQPLPGAIRTVAKLTETSIPHVFASNQTAKTREQLAEQLRARGLPVDDEDVITTSSLTAALLRKHYPGGRIALYADRVPFATDHDLLLVDECPDVVVLAGAGAWLSHEALNSILRQLRAGADLVAMHSNLAWMDCDGLALDTGALLPGIEAASGRRARVVGKPSPAFFEQALASKGIAARGALMVGDDIESDVLAAQRLGMTGVLVRTGKYAGDRVRGRAEAPDHVIDSIADLPSLLGGGGVR